MTHSSAHAKFRMPPVSSLVATMMIAGCASMGSGSGIESFDGRPVAFAWDSKDGGNTGNMSATLDGNVGFDGPFLQMVSTIQTNDLAPLWYGWHAGWPDWNHDADGSKWSESPEAEFSTHYSGEIVANLKGEDSQQLRCRFHLNRPSAGMRGGGQGECQLTGGRTVSASFARA